MKKPDGRPNLTIDLIINGKVMPENLSAADRDEEWLIGQLKKQDIHSLKEVFYAGLLPAGNLYISLKGSGRQPAD